MQKHKHLMGLLNKLGIDDEGRHEMIFAWTSGRTTSSRCLFDDELRNLIWKLENDFFFRTSIDPMLEAERRKKRSEILAIAQRCGIHDGTSFDRFNRFMLERSTLKKELHKYTLPELDALIRQFRALERNYLASSNVPGSKAYNHRRGFSEISEN